MQYSSCFVARRLFVTLLAAPILGPAIALSDDAASLDHGGAPPPLELTMPARPTGANLTFERQFGETFFRDYWAVNPERAISAGQFEFADRTVVLDARARAQAIGKLNAWLSQLHRFDPDSLNEANRSDWWLLNNTFEAERWALTEHRAWEWNPALYDAAAPLAAILQSDYASLEQRLRCVLKRLNDVSTYYSAARQNLMQPAHEYTVLAIENNRQGLELLGPELNERVAASQLRNSEKALFTRRIAAARIAIEEYITWLQALNAQFELNASMLQASNANPGANPAAPATVIEYTVLPAAYDTSGSPDHSSLVRAFFGNSVLTDSWSARQARVQLESAGNIRQSALAPGEP